MLLEVAVLHPRDVPGAQEGGADRLFLVGAGGLSPTPTEVTDVVREADVPVRVMLRLNDSRTTTGGEFARLVGLASDYAARGAEGVSFGFLDADLEVDVETCTMLAGQVSGLPWTFHDAIDDTLDAGRSWRRVASLPGLDSVCSAGSPRGLSAGYDDLLRLVEADPVAASLLIAGEGLLAEHVPWFARAGVRAFRLTAQARPGGSTRAYVDPALVRSWRLLLDDVAGTART